MDVAPAFHPSAAGLLLSVASVVAGAPLFSDGLRALRLRRQLRRVRAGTIADAPDGGFAHLQGRVVLEAPLFAPLSGAPCAGFDLEFRVVGTPIRQVACERRPFRIVDGGQAVRVEGAPGRWSLAASGARDLPAGEALTASLVTLLARAPAARWWRRAGGRLRIVERALLADARCHVIGMTHVTRGAVAPAWERTGTDDRAAAGPLHGPALTMGSGDHLEWLWVGHDAPRPGLLDVPLVRGAGLVFGPLLGLTGMLYLANAAEYFRSLGHG